MSTIKITLLLKEYDLRHRLSSIATNIEGISDNIARKYAPTKAQLAIALELKLQRDTTLLPLYLGDWIEETASSNNIELNAEFVKRVLKTYVEIWISNIKQAVENGTILIGEINYTAQLNPQFKKESNDIETSPMQLIINDKIYQLHPQGNGDISTIAREYAATTISAMNKEIEQLKNRLNIEFGKMPLDKKTLEKYIHAGIKFIYLNEDSNVALVAFIPDKHKPSKVRLSGRVFEIPSDIYNSLNEYFVGVSIYKTNNVIDLKPVIIDAAELALATYHPNVSLETYEACTNLSVPIFDDNPEHLKSFLHAIANSLDIINYDSSFHRGKGEYNIYEWVEEQLDDNALVNESWVAED